MTGRTDFDVCIVGGGLVGLAVARALLARTPTPSIVLLEKEDRVATHQSGHNSGVIHSGLYYAPGSLKAKLSVSGRRELYDLAQELDVPHQRCGKLVVATDESELGALAELHRRGEANGLVGLRSVDARELLELEPAVRGVAGLHVPETGVIDFGVFGERLAAILVDRGLDLRTGRRVTGISGQPGGVVVETDDDTVTTRALVNCAGLHSDRVAEMAGLQPSVRIVPFRGEYYNLAPPFADRIRHLVYPVPDARFPFLGVHFTRMIDGTVEVGPNAVLALGREHYRNTSPNWADVWDWAGYPGTWRLAARHARFGAGELLRSRLRTLYARRARRLVPALRSEHLVDGWAGVRAQAVDRQGRLIDDFVIESAGRSIHVLNAPSPGATASLAIGRHIADLVTPLIDP